MYRAASQVHPSADPRIASFTFIDFWWFYEIIWKVFPSIDEHPSLRRHTMTMINANLTLYHGCWAPDSVVHLMWTFVSSVVNLIFQLFGTTLPLDCDWKNREGGPPKDTSSELGNAKSKRHKQRECVRSCVGRCSNGLAGKAGCFTKSSVNKGFTISAPVQQRSSKDNVFVRLPCEQCSFKPLWISTHSAHQNRSNPSKATSHLAQHSQRNETTAAEKRTRC